MNITVKTLPKSEVMLSVEVPDEKLQKYYEKAARQVSEMVKIPGFRPGHVPLDVLKQHVKEEAIENHMLDISMPELYTEAVKAQKIQAISRPKIEIKSVKPLKFEATVAVYPEVKIAGYDKVNIKKNEPKVTEKDIEEVLEDIRKRHAGFKDVDRAAKSGDKVEIDFEGFDEGGATLENTKSANHPLVIGEGSLVPGFEEELVGLKKGDKKSFKITFPATYFHKPFQGKKVEFKVEMKRILEITLPEFTPEFLKTITGSEKSITEVKKTIEHNLLHDKKHQETVRRENEYLEKIIELTKVEIPEILIEEETDGIIEEIKSDMEQRGIPFDKYLEQSKKKIEDLRSDHRKEAEKRLTLRFGLQQLFEQEKIDVSHEEVHKEMERVINLYPEKERHKVSEEYKHGSYLERRLENKLKMEKLFERFLGK